MRKTLMGVIFMMPLAAFADDRDALKELDSLKKQIAKLEKEVSKQKVANSKKDKNNAVDSTKKEQDIEKLLAVSDKIQFGGKFEFDMLERKGKSTSNPSASKRYFNTQIAAAKLSVKGNVTEDLAYKIEYNLKSNALKKAFIDFKGLKYVDLKLGRFSQDFGMSSDDKFTNDPASLILANVTDAVDGLRVSKVVADKIYLSGAVSSDNLKKGSNSNNFRVLTLRGTYNPINTDKYILHVGMSGQWNKAISDSNKEVSYSSGYDSAYGRYAVDSTVLANKIKVYGLDFAFASRSFAVQSEILRSYNSITGAPKARYKGEYVQVSYALTGESHKYDVASNGEITLEEPKSNFSIKNGGTGAWELAVRYNHLNMGDNTMILKDNVSSIGNLGKIRTLAYGVNWYWNKNFVIKANYIRGYSNASALIPNNKPQIFLIKAQLSF